MNENSIVVQRAGPRPERLILLFHGVGATPESLLPLSHRLAAEFSRSTVVSVAAPYPSEISLGYQWFSVHGIDEANRPARVAAAMPAFLAEVGAWQESEEASVAKTVLVGFSQGAIMALEASLTVPSPAGEVVSIAGRFAQRPSRAAEHTRLHLLHGKLDAVINCHYTVDAADDLRAIGAAVSIDLVSGVGHEIDAKIINLTVRRLQR